MAKPHSRRTLVPRSAIVATVVIVLLAVAAGAASVMVGRSQQVEIPDVTGLAPEAARALLGAEGFEYAVAGTRVSPDVPAGDIISQEPAAGSQDRRGRTVEVILSAGPQTVIVPDVLGADADTASVVLKGLGLTVAQVVVSAESTAGIVLELFPAPGSPVSVGDEIRMNVAGEPSASDVLLPYDLTGLSVLLDPQPAAGSTADAPMEIGRRLQSLLEAAGATVTTTRTNAAPPPSPATRAEISASSTADLLVGLDLSSSGTPGLRVLWISGDDTTEREQRSLAYASAITRAANLPGLTLSEPTLTTDAVLAAFPRAGVRVVVGDATLDVDRARFADPAWADQVARAIYRGIGTAGAAK